MVLDTHTLASLSFFMPFDKGFFFFFPACFVRAGVCEAVRSKDNLYAGVSHHHLPGRLLCF